MKEGGKIIVCLSPIRMLNHLKDVTATMDINEI